ncbi:MAG: DMT family transporter [Acidimicrobiia bacterium]|nr:DMT family transporter [Acidimicrobiia bacterium]
MDAAGPGRDGGAAIDGAAAHRSLVHEVEEAAWETRRPLLPELALVGATIAFGATFTIVQDALDSLTPVGFILLRFLVGTMVLLPIALRVGWRRRDVAVPDMTPRSFAVAGLVLGAVAFAGYWLQNLGLQRTTTSSSAFITGLFVVFTPLVETVARRRAPSRTVLTAVAIAAAGLFLLTGATFSPGAGELFTLGCAACFGAWIYLGGMYVNRYDAVALTAVQMGAIVVFAAPVVLVGGLGTVDGQALFAVLFTGVVCSGSRSPCSSGGRGGSSRPVPRSSSSSSRSWPGSWGSPWGRAGGQGVRRGGGDPREHRGGGVALLAGRVRQPARIDHRE